MQIPMKENIETEIEVAYLCKELPAELLTDIPTRITDIYLSDEKDLLTKIRLRQKGETYEFTKKVNIDPSDLSIQNEYNVPLSKNEFEKLRGAGGREVVKDRYTSPYGKHILEIDVFRGELEGFVLVEVEFAGQTERDAFKPPAFCSHEVTQENFIAGAYLAGKSLADIQPDIDRILARA